MCGLDRDSELGEAGVERNVLIAERKGRSFCQVLSFCLSPPPFLFSVLQPGPMAGLATASA